MPLPVHFTRASGNTKTGNIPVTTSSRTTCPTTCSFKDSGCYASNFPLSLHWDKVSRGERGMPWEDLLDEIHRLPKGQAWRHNQAGDLEHVDGVIDAVALRQLTKANKGKCGWSYTHHKLTPANVKALHAANKGGFTINASTDSLADADRAAHHNLPLVTVVPRGWDGKTTPGGLPVTVCPAQRMEHMTCAVCKLCQKADRRAVVAFEAHGSRVKVIELKLEKA